MPASLDAGAADIAHSPAHLNLFAGGYHGGATDIGNDQIEIRFSAFHEFICSHIGVCALPIRYAGVVSAWIIVARRTHSVRTESGRCIAGIDTGRAVFKAIVAADPVFELWIG